MKKIMMMAAVICAAVATQAAVVNWGGSAKITLDGVAQAGAVVDLYLVDYDGLDNDLLIDTRTTVNTGAAANKGMLNADAGSVQTPFNFGENTVGEVTFNISAASQVYAIITSLDGEYQQQTTAQALTGLTETQQAAITFTFSDVKGDTVGTWQAVPEPTSGLLLLLGMAGLALRRKQA